LIARCAIKKESTLSFKVRVNDEVTYLRSVLMTRYCIKLLEIVTINELINYKNALPSFYNIWVLTNEVITVGHLYINVTQRRLVISGYVMQEKNCDYLNREGV
jgi:hypothetical protein